MSKIFKLILLISIVLILSINGISATNSDNDNLTATEYDTYDISTENIDISNDLNLNNDELYASAENSIKVKSDDDNKSDLNCLSDDGYEKTVAEPDALKSSLKDSLYASNETNTTNTTPTKITVKSTKIVRGTYFTVYLYDSNGNALSGQTVTFNIKGKTYSKTTTLQGSASLKISYSPGKYNIKVNYAGTTTYESVSKTVTITSYRLATTITPSSKTVTKGNSFTVTLKDKSGNLLSSKKVIFKISSKKYTKTTNSKGKASITINLKAKNHYTVKVTYKGSVSYKSSSKTVKIYVKSKTSSSSSSSGSKLVVNGKSITRNGKTYTTSSSNTNTVLVKNGGKLTLKNSKVIKKGDVSNSKAENSDFYGTNAAILVTAKSTLKIENTKITTKAKGGNAIFVTNLASSKSGATAYITNVEINTYKDKSRGLDVTYGGKIIAESVTIKTRGGSCAALATDRGEGTIIANNCKLYTGVGQSIGSGSPLIYSTGSITVTKSTGTSYVSQIACIEGKNSINLTDCDFTGYGKGNRYVSGKYIDQSGIFLYQSMSGDAASGTSKFTATNTKLTISSQSSYYKSAPMFYVTNTDANIKLDNCTLNYGSGTLLNAAGQSQWGKSGSNGGDVTFTASNMDLSGKIVIDKISSLKLTLTNANYSGSVNPSSSYGTTKLVINSESTWNLTGDSHVTSLTNTGTINYGSYTLYVNDVAYSAINPYTG